MQRSAPCSVINVLLQVDRNRGACALVLDDEGVDAVPPRSGRRLEEQITPGDTEAVDDEVVIHDRAPRERKEPEVLTPASPVEVGPDAVPGRGGVLDERPNPPDVPGESLLRRQGDLEPLPETPGGPGVGLGASHVVGKPFLLADRC